MYFLALSLTAVSLAEGMGHWLQCSSHLIVGPRRQMFLYSAVCDAVTLNLMIKLCSTLTAL